MEEVEKKKKSVSQTWREIVIGIKLTDNFRILFFLVLFNFIAIFFQKEKMLLKMVIECYLHKNCNIYVDIKIFFNIIISYICLLINANF